MALINNLYTVEGWQDSQEVCALASELSSLGLNPDPAINCHPGVSHAGQGSNVCAINLVDVKPEDSSARIGRLRMLKMYGVSYEE